jgi:hypothetical protein
VQSAQDFGIVCIIHLFLALLASTQYVHITH